MRFRKLYCTHCRINGDKTASGRAAMYQKSFRHRLRERCVILAAGCIGFTTPRGYGGETMRRQGCWWWRRRRRRTRSSSSSSSLSVAAAAIARRRNPFSLCPPPYAPLPLSAALALSYRHSHPLLSGPSPRLTAKATAPLFTPSCVRVVCVSVRACVRARARVSSLLPHNIPIT